MTGASDLRARVLVAIPAHNEAATVESVIRGVRAAAPDFDVLVINDGSTDATGDALARAGTRVATHLCNLGYGRAVQTAIRYAQRCGYEAIITFDADAQHRADDLVRLYEAFRTGSYDVLIGSRFVERREYSGVPLNRRIGMWLFSTLTALVTGRRVYDTSSGLKVIGRNALGVLSTLPVVDFHAEAIVYLLRSGYSVGEFPIAVDSRRHGQSMYGTLAPLTYPLKVLFLIVVSAVDARHGSKARHD